MFNNIYQGRNILVTGHTGFKGSWLVAWLNELGANVSGFSLDVPTAPNHYELLALDLVQDIRGDIRDINLLKSFFDITKPELVFHLAAQSLVRPSYEDPLESFSTNIQGTANVLEVARTNEYTQSVVVVTSDKCYENLETTKRYKETDRMGGFDPYSASKGCAELVTSCYQRSYSDENMLFASVRAGNVIGGGDWAKDRLVPDLARSYVISNKLQVRQPNAIRPWQHVLEPLSGYLLLGQKLLQKKQEFQGGWNFGPLNDETYSVGELLKLLSASWNIAYSLEERINDLHEAKILKLDSSKARDKMGWLPVWSPHEMVKYTAEWYMNYFSNDVISTRSQINSYVNDAKIRSNVWVN